MGRSPVKSAGAQMATASLFDPPPPAKPSLRERFEAFDAAHPEVWQMFERLTWDAIRAGRRRFSAKTIFGKMRWDTALHADDGEGWKVNNSFTAYYARKFMDAHPAHDGFFETRRVSE